MALDKAHECIINRKLKQITTRPLYFGMVGLADFVAYLDSVVSSLDLHVFKYYKHSDPTKNSTCMRANLVIRTLCTSSGNRKVYYNILTGSDYISTFFRTSKQTFVKAFVDNLCHTCPDNAFVDMFSIRNRWIPLQKD